MKLTGMTLETEYFEDYLSFMTEVLELNLQELTDLSMRLDLQGTWLEIIKVLHAPHQVATVVEFSLTFDEIEDLIQKFSFFEYRRGTSRFVIMEKHSERCQIIDPDGRTWRFSPSPEILKSPELTL